MKRTFFASWEEEVRAWMDYLHGDVIDGEFASACTYEYARESKVLREAAELRRKKILKEEWGEIQDGNTRITHVPNLDAKVSREIETRFRLPYAWRHAHWRAIWKCPEFPGRAWNDLTTDTRKRIVVCFPKDEIGPLWNPPLLDALPILDKMKRMLSKIENLSTDDELSKHPASVEDGQWLHVLFTVDSSKTPERLLQVFKCWLALPENRKRFEKYCVKPSGKTGTHKDRLKKLAECRLYERLGYDGALKFTEANRKLDMAGGPRAFHDARRGQQKVPLNQAPLWSEEPSARKAAPLVREYLAQIIPWAVGEKPKSTFLDKFSKEVQRLVKISRRKA